MESNFWFAFALTMLAGLATGIGSVLAFFTKKDNTKFLSVALGFSAGVMIYVSMIEIFQEARNVNAGTGTDRGSLGYGGGFFRGNYYYCGNRQACSFGGKSP